MCGRFTSTSPLDVLLELFFVRDVRPEVTNLYRPRFNAAPSQPILVIGRGKDGRAAAMHRWGLVPRWAKDASMGAKMINARSESVLERPAYRDAFRLRRCLIPADGLYEWKREGNIKQPHRFTLHDESPFAFAGLWDEWRAPNGVSLRSCTILTTQPNALIEPVHNRMPVILRPDTHDTWLDPETKVEQLLELLSPYPADLMRAYPVSTAVNSPANDDETLVKPLT